MSKVIIMQGLPASGKSTIARNLDDVLRFNMDDQRRMMWGERVFTRENERLAFDAMIAGAKSTIRHGGDIVLDNCHLTPGWPKRYKREFGPLGVKFEVISLLGVSKEECIARDAVRTGGVGPEVIERLEQQYRDSAQGGFVLDEDSLNQSNATTAAPTTVGNWSPRPDLKKAILVDIDGTVAIHDGSRGHYEYDKVHLDTPNKPVIELVRSMIVCGYDVVFMSGREDSCRAATEHWLSTYVYNRRFPLHMRKTGDHRADDIIKRELFDAHVLGNHDIVFVLDDRDRVVRMWRDYGLTVLQVADGNF